MIRVKAILRLYSGEFGRKTGFKSGYRPLFDFIPEMKTSGQILLQSDKSEFYPGDEDIVEIVFGESSYLGDSFGVGSVFTFGEGGSLLGEGTITEIVN